MAEKQLAWTTWEELLLACAVKRHGLKNWDSVAMELQNRSSLPLLMTAQVCKNKYHDLKRRFTESTDDELDHDGEIDTIPWLEELRKLRVAELKQEVHRYDLSIQSLQLKVKRLEEEREMGMKESENDDEKPDLVKDFKERSENEKENSAELPAPETAGEGSDRENRSFNESNSTENRKAAANQDWREPVQSGEVKPDPATSDSKPNGEDSYNDSSDTVAKQAAAAARPSRAKEGGNPAELRDTAGESKEWTKESSDVQSTASLTRKRRRKQELSGRISGGGGPEPAASPATIKREAVKSEPLVRLLDIIRSHKHGSIFERRLQSQKTNEYKNMVRHHVDLETIRTRLDKGSYASCVQTFYRDLLLVFNNALVFFPKGSSESVAANELRHLVSKELHQMTQRSDSSQEPAPSKPEPLLAKREASVPIVVCRKRSSISGRASNSINKATEKEKPTLNSTPPLKTSTPEQSPTKANKTKERPVTGTRSLRRSSKGQTMANTSGASSGSAQKGEAPKKTDAEAAKRRGAADFLRRIKRNSASKETPVKTKVVEGKKEQKKREGRKGSPASKRSGNGSGRGGSGRRMKEESSSPSKRGVGRPPKEVGGTKRGRDVGEAEGSSRRAKKRSRR
ncbi:hypothetical protein NMG60_11023319 [Bertholletia excelsa]